MSICFVVCIKTVYRTEISICAKRTVTKRTDRYCLRIRYRHGAHYILHTVCTDLDASGSFPQRSHGPAFADGKDFRIQAFILQIVKQCAARFRFRHQFGASARIQMNVFLLQHKLCGCLHVCSNRHTTVSCSILRIKIIHRIFRISDWFAVFLVLREIHNRCVIYRRVIDAGHR